MPCVHPPFLSSPAGLFALITKFSCSSRRIAIRRRVSGSLSNHLQRLRWPCRRQDFSRSSPSSQSWTRIARIPHRRALARFEIRLRRRKRQSYSPFSTSRTHQSATLVLPFTCRKCTKCRKLGPHRLSALSALCAFLKLKNFGLTSHRCFERPAVRPVFIRSHPAFSILARSSWV